MSQPGFPLTRSQRDGETGIEYSIWLATATHAKHVSLVNQDAVFFVRQDDHGLIKSVLKDLSGWTLKPLALSNLNQASVSGLYCHSISLYREVIRRLETADVEMMEEDIRPVDRYFMERFIRTGAIEVNTSKGVALQPVEFSPCLTTLSLDIETTLKADRILSIGLQMGDRECVLFNGDSPEKDWCIACVNEKALLQRFVEIVSHWDPDLIIGWNLIGFDLRVLNRRAQVNRVPLTLGRDGSLMHVDAGATGRWFARLAGRVAIDGIETLKGATWQFDSFSLEHVAQQLLGRGKAIDNPYDRGEKIQSLFRHDKLALATYNLEDCRLVTKIFEQAELLEYLIERTRLTGLPLDKVGGSQAAFDNLYLPRLHRSGFVAPPYASGRSDLSVPGGFVMDSRPGFYRNVLVFDFKSLYPSIIRTFSIDPLALALASELPKEQRVSGFYDAEFNPDVAILPNIIHELWHARDQAKSQGHRALSQAIKIQMNACYGVLGSNVCRFYDQRLSAAITLRGHELLRMTARWIEQHRGHQVIYGDTDSVFVWLGDDWSSDSTPEYALDLAKEVTQWLSQVLQETYRVSSCLELQFESEFERFLMPTMRHSEKGSKKRYAGLKRKNSQVSMVFKGLETVRSDWTPLAKQFQTELFENVFKERPWQDVVRHYVEWLPLGKLDHLLIYKRRLRRPLDAYQVSNPPHVKAARKLQRYLATQGLDTQLGRGDRIEYIVTLNGPEPIACRKSSIDYQHYLEKQLRPVADTLLPFLGSSFDQFTRRQTELFE